MTPHIDTAELAALGVFFAWLLSLLALVVSVLPVGDRRRPPAADTPPPPLVLVGPAVVVIPREVIE